MLGCEAALLVRHQEEWLLQGINSGSTALVATVMDDQLLVANVGDCRLLLISEARDSMGNRTAFVSRTTADHNCKRNPHEVRRVREAGGHINEDGYVGSLLEVSRSMGDFLTKAEVGHGVIIADPEVFTWKLGPQELLVVAVSDVSSVSLWLFETHTAREVLFPEPIDDVPVFIIRFPFLSVAFLPGTCTERGEVFPEMRVVTFIWSPLSFPCAGHLGLHE